MIFTDWGLIDYKIAWDKQKQLFEQLVESKLHPQTGSDKDVFPQVILCQHPHVYTLGRNGNVSNLLISNKLLKNINASFYHIDRGGDITYHGPGQLVGYPILDLAQLQLSLKEYVFLLEETIIQTIEHYGIKGNRLKGATGVWLEENTPNARKICAIGIRASHYITMHGFALNINTDLSYFKNIHPCGFIDKDVTSMEKELQKKIAVEEVKKLYIETFKKVFKK